MLNENIFTSNNANIRLPNKTRTKKKVERTSQRRATLAKHQLRHGGAVREQARCKTSNQIPYTHHSAKSRYTHKTGEDSAHRRVIVHRLPETIIWP